MFRTTMKAAALAVALGVTATAAHAGLVSFSGSRFNIDAPGPQSSRCGARTTINIRPGANSVSTGASNLGGFVPILSHCIQLPPPGMFDLGEFSFEFAQGDILTGTYAGTLSFLAPGQFTIAQQHVVTGGTGRFAGAGGTFTSSGSLSFLNGQPQASQTFSGVLDLPAVPEPQSWALLITGFGLAGATMRRRATRLRFT